MMYTLGKIIARYPVLALLAGSFAVITVAAAVMRSNGNSEPSPPPPFERHATQAVAEAKAASPAIAVASAADTSMPAPAADSQLKKKLEIAAEFKADAAEMLQKKIFYSIDYESHEVRISPVVWGNFKVDFKKNFLKRFYIACCTDHLEYKVKVLSDVNDDEFAEFDDLWGATIYR